MRELTKPPLLTRKKPGTTPAAAAAERRMWYLCIQTQQLDFHKLTTRVPLGQVGVGKGKDYWGFDSGLQIENHPSHLLL